MKNIWERLQQQNYKSFYLAFTRVALSLLLLKELAVNWNSMHLLYGTNALASPKDYGISKVLFISINSFQQHHVIFLALFAVLLVCNIFGIGKWFTALLLFLFYDFLMKQNVYVYSGAERMARLLLLYMVFANSYDYFSISAYHLNRQEAKRFSNLISNLATLSIMLQLCLAYFASAIAKLGSNLWQKGLATFYIFQLDSYRGSKWNAWLARQKWFSFISNYFTLAFELLFPFLIWMKALRKPLLIIGILFHFAIYFFMMIYEFQLVFMLCYGFFVPNKVWLGIYHCFKEVLANIKPIQVL